VSEAPAVPCTGRSGRPARYIAGIRQVHQVSRATRVRTRPSRGRRRAGSPAASPSRRPATALHGQDSHALAAHCRGHQGSHDGCTIHSACHVKPATVGPARRRAPPEPRQDTTARPRTDPPGGLLLFSRGPARRPCTGVTGYAIIWVSIVPDDHHIPMLMPEVRMSITEVEATYTEAAR